MSTASTQSRGINRRIDSVQSNGRLSREASGSRRKIITHNHAYTYALRAAYLHYLLQPRQRRTQHVPAPQQPIQQRTSTAINELVKDIGGVRDSKSTRLPHGFMAELEKRLTGVLMGKEKRQEYSDSVVRRTFAVFYTAFSEKSFRSRMEKDRRVEDLVLIFYSGATRELQKGKAPGDDSWKLMADRHVALFVRLISTAMKDQGWVRDRPELTSRLATLESKLLAHDQDLAASSQKNGASGGTTVEVIVPLSYDVKDMPLVQVVGRIFGLTNTMLQSDIDKNRPVWTEKAALQDLKMYQNHLNLNTKRTLRSDDFDLEEGYEAWRKAEGPDLSQMMLAIVQSNPELAKSTAGSLAQFNAPTNGSPSTDSGYAEMARKMSDQVENGSYVIDQPVDMSMNENDNPERVNDAEAAFTFIPPDPRAYYRFILKEALSHDLRDENLHSSEAIADNASVKLLSKNSRDLLNEICLRWRVPYFTRIALFLDVIREKFVDQEIDLDTLDTALNNVKEAPSDSKRSSAVPDSIPAIFDRSKWTVADFALNRQVLTSLHDALKRDLYDATQHCYDQKPPPIGPVMYVLENHIYGDPLFDRDPKDDEQFSELVRSGLQKKAEELYEVSLDKEVPKDQDQWEFYHVIQLGKAVIKLAERIQKRYRKNRDIVG